MQVIDSFFAGSVPGILGYGALKLGICPGVDPCLVPVNGEERKCGSRSGVNGGCSPSSPDLIVWGYHHIYCGLSNASIRVWRIVTFMQPLSLGAS